MLGIRPEQLAVTDRAVAEDFCTRAGAHLRRCFPRECERMCPNDLDTFVAEGIERAERHEVVTEREVVRFLDLMMLLGVYWDQDPRIPWAGDLLKNKDLDSCQKLEQIWQRTLRELQERRAAAGT